MLIIDRFEGDYAVCEYDDDAFIHIRRSLISQSASEGDVLDFGENLFTINEASTSLRHKTIAEKASRLFSKEKA